MLAKLQYVWRGGVYVQDKEVKTQRSEGPGANW